MNPPPDHSHPNLNCTPVHGQPSSSTDTDTVTGWREFGIAGRDAGPVVTVVNKDPKPKTQRLPAVNCLGMARKRRRTHPAIVAHVPCMRVVDVFRMAKECNPVRFVPD